MSITGVYHFIKMISDFTRGAAEQIDIDETSPEEVDWRADHRIIVGIAAFSAVLGGIGLPLSAPWVVYACQGISLSDALERTGVGVVASPLLIMLGALLGVCAGILGSSENFLLSRLGQKWLRLLGTRSVFGGRVVCFLFAILALGIYCGYAMLIWHMVPR